MIGKWKPPTDSWHPSADVVPAPPAPPSEEMGAYGGGHGGGNDRWLVSYSDFITVMMIVGFVLFAMSNADKAKFGKLAQSLNGALGGGASVQQGLEPIPNQSLPGKPIPITPVDQVTGYMPDIPDWPAHLIEPAVIEPPNDLPVEAPPETAKPQPNGSYDPPKPPPDKLQGLKDAFASTPAASSGLLSIALQDRGLVISVEGSVLFDPGQTALKPGAETLLASVSGKLSGVKLPVMVEGTGDSVPSGKIDQWDLASLRAGAVIRYFVSQQGLSGSQFVAIGHGDANAGSDGRVHIIVLRQQ